MYELIRAQKLPNIPRNGEVRINRVFVRSKPIDNFEQVLIYFQLASIIQGAERKH